MKKFIVIVCSLIGVLFVVAGGLVLSHWIGTIVTNRFDTEVQSEHFKISYNLTDEKAIPDIQKYLEDNYERVTTDLKQPLDEPVEVKIYSDLESFHNAVRVQRWWIGNVQDWVVGTASGGVIRMVSPLNPGKSGHTYDSILKDTVHEFTHIVVSKMHPVEHGSPVFSEGIATYEAGQGNLSSANPELLPNSIEEMFSWSVSNNAQKVYACGCSFVAFIIENYGYDKFIELYKRDRDYSNNVFDDDFREIYNNWISKIRG